MAIQEESKILAFCTTCPRILYDAKEVNPITLRVANGQSSDHKDFYLVASGTIHNTKVIIDKKDLGPQETRPEAYTTRN